MRELSVLSFVTLDGVVQAPALPEEDTSRGFKNGGWAVDYWPEVMDQVEREAMAQPFDLLFGRRTYDLFAGHWPDAPKSPHGQKLNAATKYVVTSDPEHLTWKNSIPITGDVAAEVARLKEDDGPLLQVHGSSRLIQALLAHDLVDELRMWTFPVTVGGGKRLFEHAVPSMRFKLRKSSACSNGVVMTIYRRSLE